MITNSGALFVPTPFPYFPLSGAAAETNEFSFYYGGGMDGWELSSPSPPLPTPQLNYCRHPGSGLSAGPHD